MGSSNIQQCPGFSPGSEFKERKYSLKALKKYVKLKVEPRSVASLKVPDLTIAPVLTVNILFSSIRTFKIY